MFKKICSLNKRKIQYKKDLVTIKKEFTRYNPQLNVLNLENINLSQQEDVILNDIADSIKSDEKIFYLSKTSLVNKLLSKDLTKKYEIEQLLIDNKFKYETFPSDFIHCMIANHVYCFTYDSKTSYNSNCDIISGYSSRYKNLNFSNFKLKQIIENDSNHCDFVWRILSKFGWIIHSICRTSGYKSIIYVNENNKQIIVGYQGMVFKFKDLFTKGYKSYIEMLEKNLVKNHLKLMIESVNKCVELSNKLNYSLSFTGYSFGAMLAQLSLFICHKYLCKTKLVRSVAFESIGVYELLSKLNTETNRNNIINLNDLDARVYLMRPSFFNTTNTHLGTMCDIFVAEGREVFDGANELILKLLKSEFATFKEFDIEKCTIHKYYINGLRSLLPINIKCFFCKFLVFSSYTINVYTKWPCNFKLNISDFDYKILRKNNNPVNLISKYFKQAFLRIFNSTELIEEFRVLETKIDRKSFLDPESSVEKKPLIKDYSDDISYDEKFNVKILNLNNEIESYLDKIYKLYKTLNYQSSENEHDIIQFNENYLIQKHLIDLTNHFYITYDTNNIKSIVTYKDTLISKIFEMFSLLCELSPNLKTKIDADYLEFNQSLRNIHLELNKDFCDKTDSLLNGYIDLKREYDLSKPHTVIIGEYGTGKTTLAIKLAKDLISNNCNNTLVKLIDCSSIHSVFLSFNEVAGIRPINHDLELAFYDKIKFLIPFLLEINMNKAILILDNFKEVSLLNDFVALEKEFKKHNLNLTLIVPINKNKKSLISQLENYNLIKMHKLDKNECYLMLKDSNVYMEHILNSDYSMDNFINDLLVTEQNKKIPIHKINSLKNILKRNSTRKLNKNELLNYKDNLLDFIRSDNKLVYDFLVYIIHLNRNNLNLVLLKHVYKVINNYDTITDKSFEINFNLDMEYLIDMSIITESYGGNYLMSALLQHEFETRIIISDEFKLRIILVDLLALNQFAEQDRTMPNRSSLYYLHLDDLLSRYLLIFSELDEKVRNNLTQFRVLGNFFKMNDIDNTCMDSSSLSLTDVDNFFLRYRENFKNKLTEFKRSFQDTSEISINFLTNGLDILNKNVEEVKHKLNSELDEKIAYLKLLYVIDPNLEEYELDPMIHSQFISKRNRLSKSLKKLFCEIDAYKKLCINSYKSNMNKRELLHASLNAAQEYLKYFFKELESNDFNCGEKVSFNYNKALKELINLENEFFSSVNAYSYKILFPNGSIHYEESDRNEDSKLGKIFYNTVNQKEIK